MLIRIPRGLDIRLDGTPRQTIETGQEATHTALLGTDFPDVRPALAVEVGDQVAMGDTLFVDRRDQAIRYTAPGGGRVREINRGPRQSVVSIVIERQGNSARDFSGSRALASADADSLSDLLQQAGLWPAFRTRPHQRTPPSSSRPAELFVTAIDTRPLAADPAIVINAEPEAFRTGVEALAGLARRSLFVCHPPGTELPLPRHERVVSAAFAGPHPAGLPGTHAWHLSEDDVAAQDRWHIRYQDVMAIGHLLTAGKLPEHRFVALSGDAAIAPRLLRTQRGADLNSLLHQEVHPGAVVLHGSPLEGQQTHPLTHYASAVHDQLFVTLEEPGDTTRSVHTGMLNVEAFERVWPFPVPALPLLRALLIRDMETAAALNCQRLDAEDLALCSYVCPARLDYGEALRNTHAELQRLGLM